MPAGRDHGNACQRGLPFRRACRLEERRLWPDFAARSMVAVSDAGVSRPRRLPGLCELGCLAEPELHLRPLHLPLLFARDLRRFPPRLARPEAVLVSRLPAVLSRLAHSMDPRPLPPDLLLLPRRVLQIVL